MVIKVLATFLLTQLDEQNPEVYPEFGNALYNSGWWLGEKNTDNH